MKANNIYILSEAKRYVVITLALFTMCLGWTAFLIPNHLMGGGVSGIAALVYWGTGLSTGITVFAINAILLLVALKVIGVGFGIKTGYSIIMASVFMSLLQHFITDPMMAGEMQPFVSDYFLAAILGGGLAGLSIGVAFTQGGSTGGTDIIAMIVCKYRNISQGRVILICDIIIIACGFLVGNTIEDFIYSCVVMGVCSYCIDLVLTGNKQTVQAFIFTTEAEQVAERIANEMHRGVTFINGTGWYTKHEGPILLFSATR
ncbi:YitT family protein [Bacteroides heparinolyticus]